MDNIALPWLNNRRIKNWHNCLHAMILELKNLNNKQVNQVFKKYSCDFCDYGEGLNLEWPEGNNEKR